MRDLDTAFNGEGNYDSTGQGCGTEGWGSEDCYGYGQGDASCEGNRNFEGRQRHSIELMDHSGVGNGDAQGGGYFDTTGEDHDPWQRDNPEEEHIT